MTPYPPNLSPTDGSLVQVEGHPEVYLIKDGTKHHFTSPEALLWNGHNFSDVTNVTSETLQSYHDGQDISISQAIIYKYNALGKEPIFGAPDGKGELKGENDSAGVYCSYVNFKNGAVECFANGSNVGKAYAIFNPLLTKWASMGYGKSVLGCPIDNMSEEQTSKFGTKFRYQNFANGTENGALEYNLSSGNVFAIHGAIFAKWGTLGYAQSDLGLPIMDQEDRGGYWYCEFEGGNISWNVFIGDYKVNFPMTNTPPTTNPVSITNTDSLTPTISWTYNDAEGDPQQQYQVEVWTGEDGTGTNKWTTTQSSMDHSVTYAGTSLVAGNTYYVRVKAFDGHNWGTWSDETSFVVSSVQDNEPPQIQLWGAPADSNTVYDSPVLISGTVTDPSGVKSVFVNGKDVTSPFAGSTSVSLSEYVSLKEGQNEITIAATDNSENHNYKVETIHVNYISFKPNPNGYQFNNYGGDEYSWTNFCSTYGYTYSSVFSEDFTKTYSFYENYFKDEGKTGKCFGMSASSLELYNHGLNAWGYDEPNAVPQAWKGIGPFVNGYSPLTVQDWTEYYQPLMNDEACTKDRASYKDIYNTSSSDWVKFRMAEITKE